MLFFYKFIKGLTNKIIKETLKQNSTLLQVHLISLLFIISSPAVRSGEHPHKVADYARLSHSSALLVYAKTTVEAPQALYQDGWSEW